MPLHTEAKEEAKRLATQPREEVQRLSDEVREGESEKTPLIARMGLMFWIGLVVVLLTVLVFVIAYWAT